FTIRTRCRLGDEVSWLPLDIAARSMVDTTVARGALLPPVINSFHPRPIQWTHIINLFEEVLKSRAGSNQAFSIVPFREWNERVACAASAVEEPKRNNHKRFPSTRIQHVIDKIIFWIAAHTSCTNAINWSSTNAQYRVSDAMLARNDRIGLSAYGQLSSGPNAADRSPAKAGSAATEFEERAQLLRVPFHRRQPHRNPWVRARWQLGSYDRG
ncbi:hypothetical protein BDV93DRAFT_516805, partial [Ceratobasidium sp. AG-I]